MSSLTGIAQFTNRFASNIMGYEDDKKKEAESVADKQYDRARQQQSDIRTQQNHDVTLEENQITLGQNRVKNKEFNDSITYEQTRNQLAYLKSIGADEQQSIDVLSKSVNSNSKLPYTIEFERGQDGKIIQRQDENGKPFYFQTIIDKETGQELGRKGTTFEEATGNYNKLQNAGAIEDEIAAAQAARAAQIQKSQDELSLYSGKKSVDVEADNIKSQRDHIYKVDEMGIKHGYTVDELGIKQGYTIDLAGVKHANAVDLANINSQNRIGEYVGRSDVDAGGTPIVGGPAWGSFDALIGPESGGRQVDKNGRTITSPVGAKGIAQVMPETAKYVARKHGIPWDDNRYKQDANYNYNLGKLYYQEQLNRYGHPALAYAAYNAGPGAVDKWIKKNPAMRNPDAMGMKNFINAIPFSETKNYVAKIHRQSSSNSVSRSVPAIPKLPKGGSKKVESAAATNTAKDYDAVITKGLSKTQKSLKSLGLKPDAASAAILAETATFLRDMGKAGSAQEVSDIYGDVYLSAQKAIPASKLRQMTKAQRSALTNQIIYSIAGVSSAKEIRQAIERFNPAARGGGKAAVSAGGLTLNLPGQQVSAPTRAAPQSAQSGKLQALYARGLPAVKTDPKAQENIDYLGNLNDNMDW